MGAAAVVLAAVVFRDLLLQAAVGVFAGRLAWLWARQVLAAGVSPLGAGGEQRPSRLPAWIAAAAAAWAAVRVPRELRRRRP